MIEKNKRCTPSIKEKVLDDRINNVSLSRENISYILLHISLSEAMIKCDIYVYVRIIRKKKNSNL
jgi:hypothetical protein